MSELDYALLDCGDGRRLEQFAEVIVDRPAPAAVWKRALPASAWQRAQLNFSKETGWQGTAPDHWRVRLGSVVLGLHPAQGAQIGVFPEHGAVSDRLESALVAIRPSAAGWRALSLFAHTGLATLRLASIPHVDETVHVDAQPAAVRQAKQNAVLSGMEAKHIRWLVDDAMLFLGREQRRGREYHIIVADPPAYGRKRRSGSEWKLERDLPGLLHITEQLLAENGVLCLTCHPAGWDGDQLARFLRANGATLQIDSVEELSLTPESGAPALPAGLLALMRKVR